MTEREIRGCDLIICSDALNGLHMLPDGCVNTCLTSPPYFRMRDYGMDGQIGMESSPDDYISRLVAVFDEVYRVLRDDGTLWINIADAYTGGGRGGQGKKQQTNAGSLGMPSSAQGLREKNLIGIPWMLAFALRDKGWYLRNDIIWSKPNPMPESEEERGTSNENLIRA